MNEALVYPIDVLGTYENACRSSVKARKVLSVRPRQKKHMKASFLACPDNTLQHQRHKEIKPPFDIIAHCIGVPGTRQNEIVRSVLRQ